MKEPNTNKKIYHIYEGINRQSVVNLEIIDNTGHRAEQFSNTTELVTTYGEAN